MTAARRGHPNREIAGMAREALEAHWRGNIEMMKHVLKKDRVVAVGVREDSSQGAISTLMLCLVRRPDFRCSTWEVLRADISFVSCLRSLATKW